VCDSTRANEAFSGKGRRYICKRCQKLPKEQRDRTRTLRALAEMPEQSHISDKNVRYLNSLVASPDAEVAEWAAVLLEIARLAPYRRNRFQRLAPHQELWARTTALGIVFEDAHCPIDYPDWPDIECEDPFAD